MSRILCINDDIFSGRRHAEPAAVLRAVPVQDTPGEEQLPPGQRLLAAQISVRVWGVRWRPAPPLRLQLFGHLGFQLRLRPVNSLR